ncbi:hypothetical protein E4T39_05605 [Aureobasidium subglaciale]|nr:hypothetical protein E4T39_05605 [Aureobasidium subglaciale]
MGGLLCAEVVLIPSLADGSLRHRLIGTVNFDVPFLGMHPRVVKVGLASIFSPAPGPQKSPHDDEDTPSLPNMQTGGDYFDDRSIASASTSNLKLSSSPFSPSQPDPNYNPAFKNDVVLPIRKGWEGAWYFLNKHSSDLRTATKQLVKSHLEFGGAMADYSGLKLRYTRIRGLEEQGERTRKAVIGSSVAPPRVRFVNYYTSSTGRPKKPKTPMSPEIPVETPTMTGGPIDEDYKTTQDDEEKYSEEFAPRDNELLETDDDIKDFEAGEMNGLSAMDHLEPAPMSDAGNDTSDIETWIDATEHMEIAQPSLATAADKNDTAPDKLEEDVDTHTAASDKPLEAATSTLQELPPIPDPPAKPEKPPFFSDKDSRKLAEKEYDRVLKLYFRAVKDREKTLKDREKLEKKRERQAIKEGKKAEKEVMKGDKNKEKEHKKTIERRETDQESVMATEQKDAKKEWKAALDHSWNDDDSTIEPLSKYTSSVQSNVLSTQGTESRYGEEQKPFKDRTFCTLPPKDGSGNRDPTWVRVLMKDVDLVEAHCGLFIPDDHDGDGFSQKELDTCLIPPKQDDWVPSANYDEYEIDSLVPGPSRIKIVGRIVNLFESSPKTKLPTGAKGSLHLVLKDDTGAVTIKLSYSMLLYEPQLSQLVAVWATYIANGDKGFFPCAVAPLYIKIFPEKDKSSHIRKDGTQVHLVEVGVMDDTDGAVLSLWGIASTSSAQWRPSQTVLLITSPGLNISHKNWLALASDTFIDVDPDVPGAATLRTFAGRMIKRQHVNHDFPHKEYDTWCLTRPNEHVLYTLADIDDRARDAPEDEFEGYLSMIIVELNMTTLRQQNMLMCNEWINPRLIGKLVDESGCIDTGKLVLSDHAWTRFLGRKAEDLIHSSASELKSVERRMLHVMAQESNSSRRDWRDMFAVPVVIKQVFAKFPLSTYTPNALPTRSPTHRDEHTLYTWTTTTDGISFNPTCLKWQTYLLFQGIAFRTQSSNNHASPSGSLPFLLPANTPNPIASSKLEAWSRTHGASKSPDTQTPRQDVYASLLDHAVRRAWLYLLYLDPDNFDHVARRLYVTPSSSNTFVALAIAHQLRNAASQELLKVTPVVKAEDILKEAVDALSALSTLLGGDTWFFGQEKPALFDASVFAYTHLLLDEEMGWRNNPLAERLATFRNLVLHRERVLSDYYQR